MPLLQEVIAKLSDHPELAVGGRQILESLVSWAALDERAEISLFLADLGASVVTSCFIPISLDPPRLYLDQTYETVVSRRHFFFVAPNWRHVTGTMMAALGGLTGFCRRAALTIRLCLMPRRRFFPRSPR